jgi:hypothetical protein
VGIRLSGSEDFRGSEDRLIFHRDSAVIQNEGVRLSALSVSVSRLATSFIVAAANQNCVVSATCVSKIVSASANL